MAVECDPDSLAELIPCWMPITVPVLKGIRIILLCAWINGETIECDPEALAESAACIADKFSETQLDGLIAHLMCQVANL
jgi:hypothetical protein